MGYPNFGKAKTITFPIDGKETGYSIEEYKEKYGIDLRDILTIDENLIVFKHDLNATILVLDTMAYPAKSVSFAPNISTTAYLANTTPAELKLGNAAGNLGISFYIAEDYELKLENLKIYQISL